MISILQKKYAGLLQRVTRSYYLHYVKQNLVLAARSCPFCQNATQFEELYSHDRYHLPVKTQRCKVCSLVLENPAPTEEFLKKFYASGAYRGLYLGLVKVDRTYANESTKKALENVAFIKKYVPLEPTSTIMDVGSACGDFLLTLKKGTPTYEIYGTELDLRFSKNERDQFAAFFPDIEQVPPDKKFDLITMWHVLEHVYDPVTFVSRIHSLLNQSGKLVIEIPNFKKYTRIKYIHFSHLFHFDEDSIKNLADRTDFEIEGIYYENLNDPETSMKVILKKR